jgi:phenylacetic acid degradation operon negative regulatory protein
MKPKTELFLYHLLWSADQLARPTFRNIEQSFEAWAYRGGLARQIVALEKECWIERKPDEPDKRICRLTEKGRLRALGGRDPSSFWKRNWDGKWRMVIFDVPMARNTQRVRLRRYLRGRGFGFLQNSVWISPDPLTEEARLLRATQADVESLVFFEARTCAGETDAQIVAGAWDFERINAKYRAHLGLLRARPKRQGGELSARTLQKWAKAEWEAWRDATAVDPFLPRSLLPRGYLGEQAWARRIEVLTGVKTQLLTRVIV